MQEVKAEVSYTCLVRGMVMHEMLCYCVARYNLLGDWELTAVVQSGWLI